MQPTRFTLSAILMLTLVSCDTFSLDEEPRTFLAEEQFFRNAADAEAAVLAAYEPFQDNTYYQLRFVTTIESMADYVDGRGSYAPGATYTCDQTCKSRMWAAWQEIYTGINRANVAIEKLPDIEMSEQKKEELLAEAHFVRALNYYNLVRYWGDVPLRTEPSKGFETLAKARSAANDVFEQIVSDLQFAESRLPETNVNGRASRWAAATLLADVFLARENWSQAAAKAKEVMDSGRFALVVVTVPDDFEEIFGPEVIMSPEEIFDIAFSRQDGFGLELPANFNSPGPPYSARPYRALFGNMNSFLSTWDTNDLRYSYNLYVGELTQYLTEAEPQRFRKFRDPLGIDRAAHGNDFPIVRYADALLIYAEASAMAGGSPTAASYDAVNRIRRRAYAVDLDTPNADVDVPQGLGLQAFRDVVIQERAYEFLVEAKRYWDLKRTGKLEEAILASGEPYENKYMLFPLPEEEIDANEALTLSDQNPGW